MAVSFPSLATAKAQIAGYFQTQLSGWDLSSKSAFGKVKAALTLTLYSWLATARQIDKDAVPTSSTSSEGLDEWAENGTGISNGEGSYGRKLAVAATGGVGSFTGASGTVYPISGTLTASDGSTKFVLTGAVTVGSGGIAAGNINATTVGIAGNLEAGAILSVDNQPVGGTSTATLTTGTTGGLDLETDAACLLRIQNRIRNPPKGGTANDYKTWAEDDAGVDGITAYVYPRRQGTGSVDIAVAYAAQTGTARQVTGTPSTTIQAYIDAVRPVTVESANVFTPTMGSGQGCAILCRVEPSPGFEFDWDDNAAAYSTAISGSITSGVRIFGRPSSGLQVGDRIQIANTTSGAPVLPEQRTVTAIDLATISGNTILVLSSGLTVYPQSGNPIYAGGPVVDSVAAAVLGLVDSLGPSKDSGYANDSNSWNATLRVDQIIRTSLNVADASSGLMLVDFVTDPTINGAATNVTPNDDGVNPPAMLWASRINIIQ
jgi:uncharacterized phage protein gp47/JayE